MFIILAAAIAAANAANAAATAATPFKSYDGLMGSTVSVLPDTLEKSICPIMLSNTSVSSTDVVPTMVGKQTRTVTSVTMTDVPEASDQQPRFSAEGPPIFSADYLWILLKKAGRKFWVFLATGLPLTFYFVYLLFSRERRREMEHTIDGVSQKSTVHWITVADEKITVIQIHADSSGMTTTIQSKFLKFYEATYGSCIVFGDINMTYKKSGLRPEEVAAKLKRLTNFTLFMSKLNINKCRGNNPLRNAQTHKAQNEGLENVDSDGMAVFIHDKCYKMIDIAKIKECVNNGTICPLTSIGIQPCEDDQSTASAFDTKDPRVLCDHSVITILFTDGSSLAIGNGASLYGRCDNAQKPGSAEIVKSLGEFLFAELGDNYKKQIFEEWNKFLTIACERCDFAEWNNIGPNKDGDQTWKKKVTKVNKLFENHLKKFKSDKILDDAVESFITNMISYQREVINAYQYIEPEFAEERLMELENKYRQEIWKYIKKGRFDKLLNYQLIGLEQNGGFNGLIQTDDVYIHQHAERLGEHDIFYVVESDAHHHRSAYKDLGINVVTVQSGGKCHSYLTKSDDCSELELIPVTFWQHVADTAQKVLETIQPF